MASQEELELGREAMVCGYLEAKELAACLRIQEERRSQGEDKPLSHWLLAKGHLDETALAELQSSLSETRQRMEQSQMATPQGRSENRSEGSRRATRQRGQENAPEEGSQRPTRKREAGKGDANPDLTDTTPLAFLEAPFLPAGRTFGRYRICEEIGRGGMGRIYKAVDTQLERVVALKFLHSGESAGETEVARFLREARATAQLQHPNIVTIYDIGAEGNQPFFAMEYIEGPSLKALADKAPLPAAQVVDIVVKICQAIHYAHAKGIVHRDLKPENVMMEESKVPKVMDFGLAKVKDTSRALSQSGVILGTIQYMAPEQAEGDIKNIDARTDVYALGVMLYELLTRRLPFEGETYTAILTQIVQDDPPPLRKFRPGIHAGLESICLKAMAKRKEERYQSAAAFAQDLLRLRKGRPVAARVPGGLRRLLKRWKPYRTLLIAALGVLALALTGFFFYCLGRRENPEAAAISEAIPPVPPEIGDPGRETPKGEPAKASEKAGSEEANTPHPPSERFGAEERDREFERWNREIETAISNGDRESMLDLLEQSKALADRCGEGDRKSVIDRREKLLLDTLFRTDFPKKTPKTPDSSPSPKGPKGFEGHLDMDARMNPLEFVSFQLPALMVRRDFTGALKRLQGYPREGKQMAQTFIEEVESIQALFDLVVPEFKKIAASGRTVEMEIISLHSEWDERSPFKRFPCRIEKASNQEFMVRDVRSGTVRWAKYADLSAESLVEFLSAQQKEKHSHHIGLLLFFEGLWPEAHSFLLLSRQDRSNMFLKKFEEKILAVQREGKALRIQSLQSAPFPEHIEIRYELVDTSAEGLALPKIPLYPAFFQSRVERIAIVTRWIEPLTADGGPKDSRKYPKEGKAYQEARFHWQNEECSSHPEKRAPQRVEIRGLRRGSYRYTVELKDCYSDEVYDRQSIDFVF